MGLTVTWPPSQNMVKDMLPSPPVTATADALQQHLKLLTEAYKRILAFADGLQVCPLACSVICTHSAVLQIPLPCC